MTLPAVLDFASLRRFYAEGGSPLDMAAEVSRRMAASQDPAVFITPVAAEALQAAAAELIARAPVPNSLPLWGMPFAVKDNIDVAGLPTTAACPDFGYDPAADATVVARLKAAGS
jgi:allophanate hydrolase